MFTNKKKNALPPPPQPPLVTEILQDLQGMPDNDVLFTLLERGKKQDVSQTSPNSEDVYDNVKRYLNISKKLVILENSIIDKETFLNQSVHEMKTMTQDIKAQAEAALL